MKKPDPRALQLACVRCGLNVEIFPTEHRHICKHCGTLLVVDRLGGIVKLKIYHESDIAVIDPTVYDPNDETSCARKELFTADAKRHQSAQHWEAFRQNRVNEWNAKNDLAKFGVRKLMRTTAVAVLVPAALVGWTCFSICSTSLGTWGAIGAAIFAFICFCAATLAITRELLKSSDKYGFEKFEEQAAEEFDIIDTRIRKEAEEASKQIEVLKGNIQQLQEKQRAQKPPPEALPSDYGELVLE